MLRSEASREAQVVGAVPADATEIYGLRQCIRDWCLVEYRGISGFILRRHLRDAAMSGAPRYRIDGLPFEGQVEVRSFPAQEADVVGALPSYASGIEPIGGCDRDWCHIRYFAVVGWVNTRHLVTEQGNRLSN
jgi:SH3-like domain-containing protein